MSVIERARVPWAIRIMGEACVVLLVVFKTLSEASQIAWIVDLRHECTLVDHVYIEELHGIVVHNDDDAFGYFRNDPWAHLQSLVQQVKLR